ncbi:MAG: phosphoglucosamine mutase, partial [Planctomycetes bacterium]|nr:phosphoglucosamine mutase [Planctomycetota bacterium]
MPARLFGTDGIRDVANTGPLTPEAVLALGAALGRILRTSPDSVRARAP